MAFFHSHAEIHATYEAMEKTYCAVLTQQDGIENHVMLVDNSIYRGYLLKILAIMMKRYMT